MIPLFSDQIANGGPVTITHPEMTRFLLSIEEAIDTIIDAAMTAERGEIYVPKIQSVLIMDVARALIGHRKIDIKVIGPRPGEKVHEILVSDEEIPHTYARDGKYFVIAPRLPELRRECGERPALNKEFSSVNQPTGAEKLLALFDNGRTRLGSQ